MSAFDDAWTRVAGSPSPLGVTWVPDQEAYNFALYSRHGTGVTLNLYRDGELIQPARQLVLDPLAHKSGRVWHARLRREELEGIRYYAYQVDGPFDPGQGHRFDPQKLLLDPYARHLYFPPGFTQDAAGRPGSNAGQAVLGCIPPAELPAGPAVPRPTRHTSDAVVYELHVRGFTRRENSGLPETQRGTYAGLVQKIPYLLELGINVVELQPVAQYLPEPGGNFWGYMPLSLFCPHQAYASNSDVMAQHAEFRSMVDAFHQAGIEVILDVVYNHTAERGASGPTVSYRGIDNSSYYLLGPRLDQYRDDAGTGNVLRTGYAPVRRLVVESLRFWAREMGVDGFRFDLASIFSRNADGLLNLDDPPIIAELSTDPEFAGLRLIAEPWDLGSYELGRGFPGETWLQWNGRFRDDIRDWVKSTPGKLPALMRRLYGSDDLFPDDVEAGYHPFQSVNFVTCHDGFTLYDLVSYNRKHNNANGHNNQDGSDDNRSWNCGPGDESDGDEVPQEVFDLRKRQVKNFCCLLLLANGTPMFRAGDEFLQTQHGNNNPYNQDNETTWLDWSLLEKNAEIFRFFKQMIAFRKAHPALGRFRFWRGDVSWYGVGPQVDLSEQSYSLAFHLSGSQTGDRDLYVMINAYWQDLTFTIQRGQASDWLRVVDTSRASPEDILEPGREAPLASIACSIPARSVTILIHR